MRFTKNLLAAAVLAVAAVPSVYAQAGATTYSGYNVSITAAAPKGSAAETAAKLKSNPTATKFTPCTSAADRDQLAFTIKYEAGSATDPATMKNLYLLLTAPGSATTAGVYNIARDSQLTASPIDVTAFAAAATVLPATAYTLSTNNPGGAQTEVFLGGNIPLEGLSSGVWTLTAVIAGAGDSLVQPAHATTGWKAWDSVSFILGGPIPTTVPSACS